MPQMELRSVVEEFLMDAVETHHPEGNHNVGPEEALEAFRLLVEKGKAEKAAILDTTLNDIERYVRQQRNLRTS